MKRDDWSNLIHESVIKAFEANKDTISYDPQHLMHQTVELSVIATINALEKLGHIPVTTLDN